MLGPSGGCLEKKITRLGICAITSGRTRPAWQQITAQVFQPPGYGRQAEAAVAAALMCIRGDQPASQRASSSRRDARIDASKILSGYVCECTLLLLPLDKRKNER